MKLKNTLLLLALSALSLNACKKDEPTTIVEEPEFEQVSKYVKKYKNGVVEVNQIPGDTVTRRASFYFSFDKAAIVTADKVKTNEWQMIIRNGGASAIMPNNGKIGSDEDPWWGNTTKMMLSNIVMNFDDVQTVPTDLIFSESGANTNILGSSARLPTDTNPNSWAYQLSNVDGVVVNSVPFTNRTTIFKLEDGRYVKFQMINCYNNTPDKNSATSKFGFFSFRYFISKAGSTDLKTK